MTIPKSSAWPRPWPDYRAVWRWHFYAGILCIPFVVFLSITGAIYLFKPQIEAAMDHDLNHRPGPQSHAPSEAVGVALKSHPGWTLHAYQLPTGPDAAAQIILGREGVERRVGIDRADLSILRDTQEDLQPMKLISRLHGELLLGDRGSNIVELAASWAIVLIVSGLYLWWPRSTVSLAGVIYPRFDAGSRLLLRPSCRNGRLGLRLHLVHPRHRTALGQELGQLPQGGAQTHRHGCGRSGLADRAEFRDRREPGEGSRHGRNVCDRSRWPSRSRELWSAP